MSKLPPRYQRQVPRRQMSRALNALLGETLAPVLRQRGFATSAVMTQWREIVGPRLAEWTAPLELRWPRRREGEPAPALNARTQRAEQATLVLACPGPFALEVQMASAEIIAAVNCRLGFGAVGSLVIKQAPRPARTRVALRPQPDAAAVAAVERELMGIEAEGLRRALAQLGAQVRLATFKA